MNDTERMTAPLVNLLDEELHEMQQRRAIVGAVYEYLRWDCTGARVDTAYQLVRQAMSDARKEDARRREAFRRFDAAKAAHTEAG